jgi:hypothetical protein
LTSSSPNTLRPLGIAALHRRWEGMALSDPLERGQDAWHLTQGQLDLEDQIRQLWEDYLTKRNAYLAATNTPEPCQRHLNLDPLAASEN